MTKEQVRKYLRLAILSVVSMIIGSVITILIKDNSVCDTDTKVKRNSNYSEFEPLYEAYDAIMDDYYKEVSSKKLIDGALDGMMKSLGDKHTSYLNKKEKENFDTELSGTYYGVGAQIQLTSENKVKIVKIFDGSPADKSGLKVGDEFVSIDGKSTEGMNASDVANKLRSEKASKAKIVVTRDGEEIEFTVKKENVTMLSVSSEMINEDDKNIGYINVSIFGQKTYYQFSEALTKLESGNMESLIIDLRGNSGGYLTTVSNMLELFVDRGKVLYKMQTNDGITEFKSNSKNEINYKIILLVDENSASASEIMAAAMKEDCGAVLVGKTTYGKGTVQTTKDLSNNAMIKYTIEKWLTPSGNNIDGEGIKPDYEVDLGEDYANNPIRENDAQLQYALDLLK